MLITSEKLSTSLLKVANSLPIRRCYLRLFLMLLGYISLTDITLFICGDLLKKKKLLGISWWHSVLRILCCHCCGSSHNMVYSLAWKLRHKQKKKKGRGDQNFIGRGLTCSISEK